MNLLNRLRLKSKNPDPRRKTVNRLAACTGAQAVELLVACLCDKDVQVRRVAAAAFNTIIDEPAINSLISALNDTNCDVRAAAAGALGRQGDLRRIAPLVREAAAKALGAMRSAAAMESLIVALTDEEYSVRLAAEHALQQIDEKWIYSKAAQRARTRLELSTNDDHSWVRSATVMLLRKLDVTSAGVQAPTGASRKSLRPEVV